ncbi:MAG: ACT domain-containing protein, partial [Actinomycetota bacterium]
METYVVRVWLPDRPGALGAVASRIGAVGGDLVGIDILERGGGKAIDELVITLPEAKRLDLLLAEMGEVDGVAVEAIRPAAEALRDPRLDALEAAAMLVVAQSPVELLDVLCQHVARDFWADWAVVADLDEGQL